MNIPGKSSSPNSYPESISQSNLSIYDPIEVGNPTLWIPARELEILLETGLNGFSLANLPLRTRSKVVKQQLCRVLGYPAPASFKKTRPRFPGQLLTTYTQKSRNLQIWNEELVSIWRYAIIQILPDDKIGRVKVVTGEDLARFDLTSTLTQKYQARLVVREAKAELISPKDTDILRPCTKTSAKLYVPMASPLDYPCADRLLPIHIIYDRLRGMLGSSFPDRGHDQERNRGADLHRLVCTQLGYTDYQDDGRFPDVRHQLLEVKLQTSPTIDLGLVCPDSKVALDIPMLGEVQIRHCDVRYAVFYASNMEGRITLTHFYLTTGEAFFSRFLQFQGKVLNKKLQIPLPINFFDR